MTFYAPSVILKHMIEIHTFTALTPGPKVLIFGAVHGDEVCGPNAIRPLIEEFQKGKLALLKGGVTFVPVANPRAHAKNLRCNDENLNRVFRPTKKPRSYEARAANVLCPLVDACDVFLDIHSTPGRGVPFIYLDFPTKRSRAWAEVLGPSTAVVGWPELYAKQDSAHQSYDTTAYAASQGKNGLLIECGQHTDKKAHQVARMAILNTLRHYGLMSGAVAKRPLSLANMEHVFFRKAGERFANTAWRHLDRVAKGAPLIVREGAPAILAPFDGYIVMPFPDAPIGHDWLYFGRDAGRK